MEHRKLGNSNLKASVIGMGCWAIGGSKWGPTDDAQSIKAILKAKELGVNFFDTADFYGFGHSEELLGKTLSKKDDAIIATKVGLRWNKKGQIRHDLSADYIKEACEASLKRLKRECIDLYQIHWPDPAIDFSLAIESLDCLVKAGKVRYVGACNLNLDQLKEISTRPWFVSYQDNYNLFQRKAEKELLPFCRQNNVAFIAYGPLFKGMLTGKFKEQPKFLKGDHRKYRNRFTTKFTYYKEKTEALAEIAKEHNITLTQLSLAALLAQPGTTTLIPGAKTAKQVEENVKASTVHIDPGWLKAWR